MVAQNGGAALFYTQPGESSTAGRLATWLMAQPWCGTITASDAVGEIPGTLAAYLVGNQGARTPDLTVSFHWDSSPNEAGYNGKVYSTGGRPGTGQHGSMSRHEINGVMFASGPSFKSNLKSEIPSGSQDLAPTILKLLGISGDWDMHGRVLAEALAGGLSPSEVEWSTEVRQAEHTLGGHAYRQQIKISRVGSTTYVDEGNRLSS